VKNQAFMIDF